MGMDGLSPMLTILLYGKFYCPLVWTAINWKSHDSEYLHFGGRHAVKVAHEAATVAV